MPRSDRLLQLLQHLRTERPPVTAARLADLTGVSERSVYRDMAALRALGARIEGQAGYGFTLEEDIVLPPQMLGRLEMEAVILGLSTVQAEGDPSLARAARDALAKITATLPESLRDQARHAALRVARVHSKPAVAIDPQIVRRAVWEEQALDVVYVDDAGTETSRRIWPLSVVFFERALILLAFCRLREDFRSFRLDRIRTLSEPGVGFRPRRVPLLREFLASREWPTC
ncbi:helix-turn-helix transcriptional regulator [Salinarimonas rosea]|uniref:helix-turn-helix transcriptional regulator n=1 Tax=Salinarimonas rosea TaxID=552063 RepID=UPI0003FEFFF5|nr:YafY family protein [Salinarimonas rosea]